MRTIQAAQPIKTKIRQLNPQKDESHHSGDDAVETVSAYQSYSSSVKVGTVAACASRPSGANVRFRLKRIQFSPSSFGPIRIFLSEIISAFGTRGLVSVKINNGDVLINVSFGYLKKIRQYGILNS